MAGFTMSGGVFSLLSSAANDPRGERNQEYAFLLSGDLCQMSTQEDFLRAQGFDVARRNVYPALKSEDVERALRLIWERRCDGWWNYEHKYVELGICTKEEYDEALGRTA